MVGLGNPGRRYQSNRHNAGYMAADNVAANSRVVARGKWPDGELALAEAASWRFLVLKPTTFMNCSGRAVAPVLNNYGLTPERMVVIHDDIDIPFGDVRVKQGGGTGGHRGLASLVEDLGDVGFLRVRIGVGRPPEGVDPADYVLTDFLGEEAVRIRASIQAAARAALDLVAGVGFEGA